MTRVIVLKRKNDAGGYTAQPAKSESNPITYPTADITHEELAELRNCL